MDSVLKVGLAGVGSVSRTILSNIETIPGVQLTGIADVRQEALDTVGKKYGVDTFTSVEAMCESANVDAVWVCTPNQFHAEHTITAAEHGKHVICEKPMAVTLEQAQSMVDAVDRNSVRYVQGHSKIFDPPVRMMREVVSSGELGRLIQLNTWEYKPWISGQPRLSTEVDPATGGGVLYRQGPHQTDIVRGIGGGMVRSLRASAGRWNPAFPLAEGDYTAFLEFEDGTAATMAFNGYGFFDITEMTWGIGEGGQQRAELVPDQRERFTGAVEANTKYAFAGTRAEREQAQREAASHRFQPFFGLTLASCERGRHPAVPGRSVHLRRERAQRGHAGPRDAWARRANRAPGRPRGRAADVPGRALGDGEPRGHPVDTRVVGTAERDHAVAPSPSPVLGA